MRRSRNIDLDRAGGGFAASGRVGGGGRLVAAGDRLGVVALRGRQRWQRGTGGGGDRGGFHGGYLSVKVHMRGHSHMTCAKFWDPPLSLSYSRNLLHIIYDISYRLLFSQPLPLSVNVICEFLLRRELKALHFG